MHKRLRPVFLLALALLASSAAGQEVDERPNILLIVGDDIAFGDLGFAGAVTHTPNIDALAEAGALFTRFHASPVCSITRAMLLTGNDPVEIGLAAFDYALYPPAEGTPGYEAYLTRTTVTIAELLQEAGYFTAMVGKWHLGGTRHGGEGPQAWGFDRSYGIYAGGANHWNGGVFHVDTGDPEAMAEVKAGRIPQEQYFENGDRVDRPVGVFSDTLWTNKLIGYLEDPMNPITAFDRMNANVLLAVTPEYAKVKAAQKRSGERISARPGTFAMEPEHITIEGKRLRFARGGKQDAPTILMLCPLPQSIICYDQIWPMLADRFHLVALDLPGFGRSEGGTEVMTFDAQSRFVDAFVRELDLSDIHIIGPDVGMPVALHYVIHRDHRARSLIVGDGPCVVPTANGSIIDKAVGSSFWRTVFKVAGAGAFVEGAVRLAYVNYTPSNAEVADYVASYRRRIGPITEWFKRYPQNLATIDPFLADLDLPVQLFWGDLDQFLLIDTAHRAHERFKRSELTIFENCGHFSYQDKRDDFAAMVADWVETGYIEA